MQQRKFQKDAYDEVRQDDRNRRQQKKVMERKIDKRRYSPPKPCWIFVLFRKI